MNLQEEARQFLADYKKMGISFTFDKTNGKARAVEDNYGKHYIAKAAMDELASAYRLHLAVIKELEELEEAERQKRKPDNKDLRGKILDAQDKLQEAVQLINKTDCGLNGLCVSMKHVKDKNWRLEIFSAQFKLQDVLKLINEVYCGLENLRVDAEPINNA